MKNLSILLFLILSFQVSAQDFSSFRSVIESSVNFRNEFVKDYPFLEKINKTKYILTGKDLKRVNETIVRQLEQMEEGVEFIQNGSDYVSYLNLTNRNSNISKESLKRVLFTLGAMVTTQDSYKYGILKINSLKKIRRIYNEKDIAYDKKKNSFRKIVKEFYSHRNMRLLYRMITVYKSHFLPKIEQFKNDNELISAHNVINVSHSYEKAASRSRWGRVKEFFRLMGRRLSISSKAKTDFLKRMTGNILFRGSKIFGNTAGRFQSRRGKLYNNESFISYTQSKLKPLDVMLEKTPFRLTDRFIPGYWGHAAIYIGTEEELKELGIWENETIRKFHDRIRNGQTIVEALRPGVQINTLKHFTDIDDFAILRMNNELNIEEKLDYITRALRQVGKIYDFGFDTQNGNSIVCSELHYLTYIDIPFNTERIVGRYTISVDQVAEQALTGGPLTPVVLYIDGKEVTKDINLAYDALIDKTYEEVEEERNPEFKKSFGERLKNSNPLALRVY